MGGQDYLHGDILRYNLSNRSKERRAGIDPRLIEISNRAIQITLIDFGIPEYGGKRTAMEQNYLYTKDLSKCDGFLVLSNHQDGKALDFYAYVDGKASWDEAHLAIVGAAFLQAANELGYRVKWGGLWKRKTPKYLNGIPYGWDMPHIELLE